MELHQINKRFRIYLNTLSRYTAATAITFLISLIAGYFHTTLAITTGILLWLFFLVFAQIRFAKALFPNNPIRHYAAALVIVVLLSVLALELYTHTSHNYMNCLASDPHNNVMHYFGVSLWFPILLWEIIYHSVTWARRCHRQDNFITDILSIRSS